MARALSSSITSLVHGKSASSSRFSPWVTWIPSTGYHLGLFIWHVGPSMISLWKTHVQKTCKCSTDHWFTWGEITGGLYTEFMLTAMSAGEPLRIVITGPFLLCLFHLSRMSSPGRECVGHRVVSASLTTPFLYPPFLHRFYHRWKGWFTGSPLPREKGAKWTYRADI